MKRIIYCIVFVVIVGCATLHNKEKILKEIDSVSLLSYQNEYSIDIPKDWYAYFEYHHLLAYSPRTMKNDVSKEVINTYLVLFKNKVKSNNLDVALKEYLSKMEKPYKNFKHKVIEANHKTYGKYYLVKYGIKRDTVGFTALSTVMIHEKQNFGFYYLAKNEYFDKYLKDVIKMINSFTIKEPN
mgnify:CR=1 FL=1